MEGIGDYIAKQLITLGIIIAVVMFGLGVLLTWGLPILWAWIKPWLHQVTA